MKAEDPRSKNDAIARVGDAEIRVVLHEQLREHYQDQPEAEALIIDELGVCQNQARMDVAVIGDTLDGYEIKSPKDTLARLQRQRDVYNRVFDRLSIVCSKEHLSDITDIIPDWWGVVGVSVDEHNQVSLQTLRVPGENAGVEGRYLAELLWREEVLQLLASYGGDRGFRSQPKRVLWPELANRMELDTLKREVRAMLLSRPDWRGTISAGAAASTPARAGVPRTTRRRRRRRVRR